MEQNFSALVVDHDFENIVGHVDRPPLLKKLDLHRHPPKPFLLTKAEMK